MPDNNYSGANRFEGDGGFVAQAFQIGDKLRLEAWANSATAPNEEWLRLKRIDGSNSNYGSLAANKFWSNNAMLISSDARLKSNVRVLDDTEEAQFNKFRAKKYVLNSEKDDVKNSKTHYGFIAQEVEAINADLVEEGDNGFKSVNYNEFIPLLVDQVQQLKKREADLLARIEKLEAALTKE